jgi:hypothetical protein
LTPRFTTFTTGFVLKWECDWPSDKSGQLSNDPNDPGGTTKFGIDKASHPGVDVANLTINGALSIYFLEWTADGCGAMAPSMGEVFFDAAVNCGVSRAKQFAFGGDALSSVVAREAFYRRLATARPNLARYLKGWLDRTEDLKKFLALS